MVNQTQLIYIHGGGTHQNRSSFVKFIKHKLTISIEKKIKWSDDYLDHNLKKDFFVIKPAMPLKENARYLEWKIYFEKYLPFTSDGVVLVGFSLGAFFLVKYLSENIFPKKISGIFLIAPPFDNSLPGEELVGGFKLRQNLSKIYQNCTNIHFLFSLDDPVIPIEHARKFEQKLDQANYHYLANKNGHFKVSKFPEIIKLIKKYK